MPSVRPYKGLLARRPSSFYVPRRPSTHIGRRGSCFNDRRHSILGRRQSSRLSFHKRPRAVAFYDDVHVEEVPDEVDMYDDELRTAHTDAVFFSTLCNVDPSDPFAVESVIRPADPHEAAQLCNRKIRSKKRKADAEKVGRPPNSWICYRGDLLRRLKGEKRGDILQRKQADLNKDIGVLWRLESVEVKGYYKKKARLLAEEHQQMHPSTSSPLATLPSCV